MREHHQCTAQVVSNHIRIKNNAGTTFVRAAACSGASVQYYPNMRQNKGAQHKTQ